MRSYTTTGPIVPDRHYSIPPLERVDIGHVLSLIQDQKYFTLHAPRQTGKTWVLLASENLLNGGSLGPYRWARIDPRPLVLLIDEIDSLVEDSLLTVLRQLRAGYHLRPRGFPHSVILCGVRDLQDHLIHSSSKEEPVTGGSAFNISPDSLGLGNFSREEVLALLGQHTEETGQAFLPDAVKHICDQTCGQPWLVNALCRQARTSTGGKTWNTLGTWVWSRPTTRRASLTRSTRRLCLANSPSLRRANFRFSRLGTWIGRRACG